MHQLFSITSCIRFRSIFSVFFWVFEHLRLRVTVTFKDKWWKINVFQAFGSTQPLVEHHIKSIKSNSAESIINKSQDFFLPPAINGPDNWHGVNHLSVNQNARPNNKINKQTNKWMYRYYCTTTEGINQLINNYSPVAINITRLFLQVAMPVQCNVTSVQCNGIELIDALILHGTVLHITTMPQAESQIDYGPSVKKHHRRKSGRQKVPN